MPAHKLTDEMTWTQIVEKTTQETQSDKAFSSWMLSRENLGGYFFDSHTWKLCHKIFEKINTKNNDHFVIISGKEGSGKSTLSMQFASVVDPTFNRSQMFNSRLSLIQWIKDNLGRTMGKALVVDEGNLVLFGRESLSAGSVEIIKLLTLVRQCNLLLIVNVPSYPSIDSYVRKHRIDSLFLINQSRKTFRHYSKKGIAAINEALRKGVQMSQIYVPEHLYYSGYWNKILPNTIDETDYKSIKLDALREFLGKAEENLQETEGGDGRILVTSAEAARITGKSRESVVELIKKGAIEGKLIGERWFVNKPALLNCLKARVAGGLYYTKASDSPKTNEESNDPIVNSDDDAA